MILSVSGQRHCTFPIIIGEFVSIGFCFADFSLLLSIRYHGIHTSRWIQISNFFGETNLDMMSSSNSGDLLILLALRTFVELSDSTTVMDPGFQ